ncbi:carcinoembryonic antigen-related cell adhesion molecule 2 isoform X2 [Parambassis ranga]|uniref:Carcinoembryonic antigen-related cell adhesion molecule 2 isoform X2 n=1 Tax=Parambassis ranga TaxID=210632 RepID=A0A6P7HSK3_9TELE|nr:carcinoembryonic antigen-related cell adhesion molecule 2-like isoform X2 [Parambassis ranga]
MDLLLAPLLLLLSLHGFCAANGILPAGPVDAIVGNNVTIKTLVVNPVFTFIIWNYNGGSDPINIATRTKAGGLKVNALYTGRVNVDPVNGSLQLAALKPADSGDYSISIVSDDGTTETAEIKVRVLEPLSNIAIKSNVPTAIERNTTVELTCSAKGSYLKFTWTNGTVPISADGKRLMQKDTDSSSVLTITDVFRSDLVGPIYCTAVHPLETAKSAPFNLTVYYGPEAVTITATKPDKYIRAKSDFNLTCSAGSNPPAVLAWYRNNDLMKASGPVLTLKVIEELGFGKQMDNYTCRAQNTETKSAVASSVVSFAVMEAISGAKITSSTATLIAGNSTANLSCQATAGTVATTTWLKDGAQLANSTRVVISTDKRSVLIRPVQKEDNGKYTCELTNPVNTDTAAFDLVVNYGPEQPTIEGNNKVEEKDLVTLTCKAASIPPPTFTWKFNDTLTDTTTHEYTISNAEYKDTGLYTCEAHNAVTGMTSSNSHLLTVKAEGELDELSGLSEGAIAGIVVGVIAALAVAIGLFFYCRQKVPVDSPY